MLYIYRWHYIISSIFLFLFIEGYYELYPLYQQYTKNQSTLLRLKKNYQANSTHIISNKNSTPATTTSKFIAYHTTDWLNELTHKVSTLAIKMHKIEKINNINTERSDVTTWQITLSGNAQSLFAFFNLLHHDFPWLAIKAPSLTLLNQNVIAEFQLIALVKKPNEINFSKLEATIPNKIFAICRAKNESAMQRNTQQNDLIAGTIQQGKMKMLLYRTNNEHVLLTRHFKE